MISKAILTATAIVYGIHGVALLFASDLTAGLFGITLTKKMTFAAQFFAGALLGMAVLNWYNRVSIVGGIYGRPLVMMNLMYGLISFLSGTRGAMDGYFNELFWIEVVLHGLLTFSFALLMYLPPNMRK